MNCERCGGEVWNNANSKFWYGGKNKDGSTKAMWTCKNKQGCGWSGGFDHGTQQAAAAPASGGQAGGKARPLAPLYNQCLEVAMVILQKRFGSDYTYTTADILSATATLFIAATKAGTPLMPVKAKPAPAPPPPPPKPPEPEPEEEVDPYADGLPF